MEAAPLASLAAKLEALDYAVPVEGLPAPAGPLLEQARAFRGRCAALRGAAAWRLRVHEACMRVFRQRS
jgi:hypothetical protein